MSNLFNPLAQQHLLTFNFYLDWAERRSATDWILTTNAACFAIESYTNRSDRNNHREVSWNNSKLTYNLRNTKRNQHFTVKQQHVYGTRWRGGMCLAFVCFASCNHAPNMLTFKFFCCETSRMLISTFHWTEIISTWNKHSPWIWRALQLVNWLQHYGKALLIYLTWTHHGESSSSLVIKEHFVQPVQGERC